MPTIVAHDDILTAGCKNIQDQINEQMAIGRNAGYPFPSFSNAWSHFKNSLPVVEEIVRCWNTGNNKDRNRLVSGVYSTFRDLLKQYDYGLSVLSDDFFVFKNANTIIINNIAWIVMEWSSFNQVVVSQDEEKPRSTLVAADPQQNEILHDDFPVFGVGPTQPGASVGIGFNIPSGGGVIRQQTGTGAGGGSDYDPGGYDPGIYDLPGFTWPPVEESKPPIAMIAMIAAIGIGAVAIFLLLKK